MREEGDNQHNQLIWLHLNFFGLAVMEGAGS